jgi:hypothetical protein
MKKRRNTVPYWAAGVLVSVLVLFPGSPASKAAVAGLSIMLDAWGFSGVIRTH